MIETAAPRPAPDSPVVNPPACLSVVSVGKQVWRRADLVMKMIEVDHFRGNTMDQALLNDAINARRPSASPPSLSASSSSSLSLSFCSFLRERAGEARLLRRRTPLSTPQAAGSNGSVYDWPSVYNAHDNGDHPFWQEHNRGNISMRGPGTGRKWYSAEFRHARAVAAWTSSRAFSPPPTLLPPPETPARGAQVLSLCSLG